MFVFRSLPAGVLPLSLIEVLLGKMLKLKHHETSNCDFLDEDRFNLSEESIGVDCAEYLLPENIGDLDDSITRFDFRRGFLTGSFECLCIA